MSNILNTGSQVSVMFTKESGWSNCPWSLFINRSSSGIFFFLFFFFHTLIFSKLRLIFWGAAFSEGCSWVEEILTCNDNRRFCTGLQSTFCTSVLYKVTRPHKVWSQEAAILYTLHSLYQARRSQQRHPANLLLLREKKKKSVFDFVQTGTLNFTWWILTLLI